jgi:beta-alanine degradation protein BauB
MFEASGMSVGQRSGWMWAVVVAVILVGTAWGQDPTKVEPKHYKLDFENDKVQVVSVHYGPHEKSSMHDHPGGVVVVVTGGHLKFTDENGKVTEVYAKAGSAVVRAIQAHGGERGRYGL